MGLGLEERQRKEEQKMSTRNPGTGKDNRNTSNATDEQQREAKKFVAGNANL